MKFNNYCMVAVETMEIYNMTEKKIEISLFLQQI